MTVLLGPGTMTVVLETLVGTTIVEVSTLLELKMIEVVVTGTPGVKVSTTGTVHGQAVMVRVSDSVAV